MATAACSDEAKLSPPQCPRCGKLLANHASRLEMDVDGNPEQVHVYLCFTHGFYTFRLSEGLRHGL